MAGIQLAINCVEHAASWVGLTINASKCSTLSINPAGKIKKVKILSDPSFRTTTGALPATNILGKWNYLGVEFGHAGTEKVEANFDSLINNICKAPLKPQQRLHILRVHSIPLPAI